jgi:hypothetical protein
MISIIIIKLDGLFSTGPGEHYADADIPARASGTDVRAAQLELVYHLGWLRGISGA